MAMAKGEEIDGMMGLELGTGGIEIHPGRHEVWKTGARQAECSSGGT